MEFYEGLVAYLTSYVGLTALISDRIYPVIIPQAETLPSVAYQDITNNRQHTLQDDPNFNIKTVEFSIYSTTYVSVKAVAKQLKLALQNYNYEVDGLLGGAGGVKLSAVLTQNEWDGFDEESKEYFTKFELDFYIDDE